MKFLISALFVIAFLFAVLSVETWRHSRKGTHGLDDRASACLMLVVGALVLLLAVMLSHGAKARDLDGRYAGSPLKQWFDGLASRQGPCCSDADGSAVSDSDWDTKDGHYRVRLGGEWIEVDDSAVITEPNRAGRTMVWPFKSVYGQTMIRCFMPGPMG